LGFWEVVDVLAALGGTDAGRLGVFVPDVLGRRAFVAGPTGLGALVGKLRGAWLPANPPVMWE
jgi:hypothetical protein